MIELKDVSFSYYKGPKALNNISLNIKKGELILLLGESGSGKTSLARTINCLVPKFFDGDFKGEVNVLGKPTKDLSMVDLSSMIGTVFQNPRNQFFTLDTTSELAFNLENHGINPELIKSRVFDIFNDLNINHLKDKDVYKLSGGQMQMVAIASACALNPEILVLDEPSANLDRSSISDLIELLKIFKSNKTTVIISEHRLYYLKDLVDRAFYIKDGEIKNISNEAMSIETLDNSINLIGDYIKQIADVMQESPKMEAIDKNAENLINSLVEEQKVLTEIDDYFEKGDYKKDRLERVQELNDKYKVVLQNRQENNKIFSNSLRELAQAINKKMEEKLKKDKKITKLNILKFITLVNEFEETAFGKNNLNFDEYELKKLENVNAKVQKEYKVISEITLENAKKENITEANFNKIKSSSQILSENMEKMVSGIKSQNIQVVVMSASNILNTQTDLEGVYNLLIL